MRHDSSSTGSPLHPGHPGNRRKAFVAPRKSELLAAKSVNSACYGTPDLHSWLRNMEISDLAICGIQTNMCVETTARMAGNLGYNESVALAATRTFDLTAAVPGADAPVTVLAAELMRLTAVNLRAGGFAQVVSSAELSPAGPAETDSQRPVTANPARHRESGHATSSPVQRSLGSGRCWR